MNNIPQVKPATSRSANELPPAEVSPRQELFFSSPTLRLIVDGVCDGSVNMQRDAALFAAGETRPATDEDAVFYDEPPFGVTVRLYSWETPTITLGRHQPKEDILFAKDAIRHEPISIVRRITGGRAVLHHEELTYCVVASPQHPLLGGSIRESYSAIAEILKAFLKNLYAEAEVASHFASAERSRHEKSAVCYDSLNWAEITVNNRKLIGAAQRRGRRVFLEHGSIPLRPSALSLNTWLNPDFQSKQPLFTITISDFLPEIDLNTGFLTLARTFYQRLSGENTLPEALQQKS